MLYAYSAKHLLFKSAYKGLFTARNSIKTAHNCIFTVSVFARADPDIICYSARKPASVIMKPGYFGKPCMGRSKAMPIVHQDHEFAYAKMEDKASPKVHITGTGKKYRLIRAMFGYGLPEKGARFS